MKKIIVALVTASLLFSCIDSNEDCDNGVVPIALTSKIVVSERSSLQDVQIVAGQKVGFFVAKYVDPTNSFYTNVLLTADGNGFFDAHGVEMYYPVDNAVNFYAMHPYNETAVLDINMPVPVSVQEDQTVLKNYYDSDLLFARKDHIEKSRQPVPMVFNHRFSKFTFVVKQGAGIDLLGLTSITVMNILNKVEMQAYDGVLLLPASGNEVEIKVYGVKGATGGETEVSGMAAIIVPQDFGQSGTKQLFKVVINGAEYFYTPSAVLDFEVGKVYNFILTVSNTGIEVTSSINDWFPGGEIIEEITR